MSTLESYGPKAVQLAHEILETEGRLRYFKDWDAEIIGRFKEHKVADRRTPITFRPGTGPWGMELRPVRVSGGITRRMNYPLLQRQQPALYSTYVTETPPENPIKLTFKAAGKLRGGAQVWDDIRSKGWVAMDRKWAVDRQPTGMYFAASDAKRLYEIRTKFIGPLGERRAALRKELAEIFIPNPRAVIPESALDGAIYGTGLILPGSNPPSRTIDLNMAERHNVLRQYITESTRADSIRWTFAEDSDDELTEDDYAARFEGD